MLKRLHRILGLVAMLFWLVQIVSGAGIEALWLIDGSMYRGVSQGPDANVLAQRIAEVRATGARAISLWAAGTVAGQMKIFYTDAAGRERVRRLGTRGDILYDVSGTSLRNREGLIAICSTIHQTFLGGARGRWLVAICGALLVSNLLIGLRLVLRRRVNLRLLLVGQLRGTRAARRFHLHRMTALWILVPAMMLTATGVVLGVSEAVPVTPAAAPPTDAMGPRTSPAQAIDRALASTPGGSLSALVIPVQTDYPYEVLVRTTLDNRRFWGTTRMRVSAHGDVILDSHRGAGTLPQTIGEAVYPFHTAQVGGVPGRVLALVTAVGLLVASGFGLALWQSQRAASAIGGHRG